MDASKVSGLKFSTTVSPFDKSLLPRLEPSQFGRVAVVMGDNSPERQVSLSSGQLILEALQRLGINVQSFDPIDGVSGLDTNHFDRAFLGLHGLGGEDGLIQGYLERVGLPYTGSNVLGSALAMDKVRSKCVFQAVGLPTPAFCFPHSLDDIRAFVYEQGLPIIIKPNASGSSVGVFTVYRTEDLEKAYESARAFGQPIVESLVEGSDYTISILNDRYLPTIKIVPKSGLYDYESKYQAGCTEYHCPSDLSKEEEKTLAQMTYLAFQALGCRHYGRADWMRGNDGRFWLLEMNTLPGLTNTSLLPKSAKAIGISFDEIIHYILFQTLPLAVREKMVAASCAR